ncbi:MAG: type III pantothenate kinase [Salibacteraceae bacterium]
MASLHVTKAMTKQLCIDIGNTRIKYAWFAGKQLIDGPHFLSDLSLPWLEEQLQNSAFRCGISDVGKKLSRQITELERAGIHVIGAGNKLPIDIHYDDLGRLGSDRVCNAVGAHALYPGGAVLVVDAGTCITLDLVTRDGAFIGGAISPGFEMRLKAMNAFTAALPRPDPVPRSEHGKNTDACMQFGAFMGCVHEIEGSIGFWKKSFPDLITVITGGNGELFAQHVESPIFAAPNLVLTGINEILLHSI